MRKIWPDARPLTWVELITEMDEALQIPGQVNAWTMPIKGRIDMLTTGIRTPIGIKIFGPDLDEIAKLGEHLESVMREIPGTRSVFAERTTGGYYLDITPNRAEIARYGLNVEDVLMQVETSIGGIAIARTIEGRERYTINVRYSRELLRLQSYECRFADMYSGPQLVGVDRWVFQAMLEIRERQTMPEGFGSLPSFLIYPDIFDRAMNQEWPV